MYESLFMSMFGLGANGWMNVVFLLVIFTILVFRPNSIRNSSLFTGGVLLFAFSLVFPSIITQLIMTENASPRDFSPFSWFTVIGQILFAFSFVLIAFSLMPTEKERFLKMQKRFEEEEAAEKTGK